MPPRTRSTRSRGKAEKILAAAITVFAQKGFQYATIADIAAEGNIAKGLIHFYFDGKLDLYLTVKLRLWQKVNQRFANGAPDERPPLERLKQLFAGLQGALLQDGSHRFWGKIITESVPLSASPKHRALQAKQQAIEEENRRLLEQIDRTIAEGQQQGAISRELPPHMLRQILGGACLQLFRGNPPEERSEDVQRALGLLIDKFVEKTAPPADAGRKEQEHVSL